MNAHATRVGSYVIPAEWPDVASLVVSESYILYKL